MNAITDVAHDLLRPHLHPGDVAIDATAGNGHDTRFLAECVGPSGRVFAFDIQKVALERTAARVQGMANVELIERSHAEMRDALPVHFHGRIAAIMFNFGYMPNGDRTTCTQAATSIEAIRAAAKLLRPGGWLSAILYTGHAGGAEEAEAVETAFAALPFAWTRSGAERAGAPRLWVGFFRAGRVSDGCRPTPVADASGSE